MFLVKDPYPHVNTNRSGSKKTLQLKPCMIHTYTHTHAQVLLYLLEPSIDVIINSAN